MKKKGLQITNDHGWTIERLQEQERKMKKANMSKRIAVIRLIMQGYLGIQIAELLNLHIAKPFRFTFKSLIRVAWMRY
jgi:hypothetical protein